MFFNKKKKDQEALERMQEEERRIAAEREASLAKLRAQQEKAKQTLPEKKEIPYKFSVPQPRPKELLSVLTRMLQKLFPEAKSAYLVLMEYQEKSGYLLIVDIDQKFLKIINLYLDGETKKIRNGLPIECILYAKSGSVTEGIEPFYRKAPIESPVKTTHTQREAAPIVHTPLQTEATVQMSQPKTEIKEAAPQDPIAEIEFKKMPEFKLEPKPEITIQPPLKPEADQKPIAESESKQKSTSEELASQHTQTKEVTESVAASKKPTSSEKTETKIETKAEAKAETKIETKAEVKAETKIETKAEVKAETKIETKAEVKAETKMPKSTPVQEQEKEKHSISKSTLTPESASNEPQKKEAEIRIRPVTRQELLRLLNSCGSGKSDEVYAVAAKAFREYKFFIPVILGNDTISDGINPQKVTLAGSATLNNSAMSKIVTLINRKSSIKAVPLFTDKEDAEQFAKKTNATVIGLPYKEIAEKITQGDKTLNPSSYGGIIINPNRENVFLPMMHPVLRQSR